MTDTSARFALPLLQPGQAQKEMFHNEALTRIDAALHPVVASIATDTPPATPAEGMAWIVGATASGEWASQSGRIAMWTAGGWRFVSPVAGMAAWASDGARWVWHDGSTWQAGPLPTAGVKVGGQQVLGARQPAIPAPVSGVTIDEEARATLAAILLAMRSHGLIES